MKVVFKTMELEYLMYQKTVWKYPQGVLRSYQKKVAELANLKNLLEMFLLRTLDVEELKGDKIGYFSARLNKGWRLIFRTLKDGTVEIVEICDITNHYQ